jgi:hypothetical protein
VRGWPACVGLSGSSCPCLNRSADPRHSAACRRRPDLSDLLDMWVIFVGHLAGNDPVVHEERRPNADCQPLFDQVAGLSSGELVVRVGSRCSIPYGTPALSPSAH